MTPRARSSSRTPSEAASRATVRAGRRSPPRRRADDCGERDARHLDRILHRQEEATPGALPGRQAQELLTVDRDRATSHLVLVAAHERVRQRRLAGSVRSHDRVHLTGTHLEVDAAQDLVAGDGRVQIDDLQACSRHDHLHIVAVDLHLVHRHGLRGGQCLRFAGQQGRTSSRASGTRSRTRLPRRRPRRASSRRASTCHRSRRSRRRCARARCGDRRRRTGVLCPEPGRRDRRAARACPSRPPPRVLELVDHRAAQSRSERADRQPGEHVVEEAEHDQPLRFFGRDAARSRGSRAARRRSGRRSRRASTARRWPRSRGSGSTPRPRLR